HTLYMGNLNPRYSREVLCSMLKDILGTASFPLQRHHIEVVKKARRAYALVQVATELSLEHVLKQLQVASDTEQQLLRELVMKGKTLVVGEGKRASLGTKEGQEPVLGPRTVQSVRWAGPGPGQGEEPLATWSRWEGTRPVALTAQGLAGARALESGSGTRSDSAIVRQEIVGQERLFYGAFMGSETRNVEFKRGGGEYLSVTLKHHVRKYEGGSLFVGVEDSGMVQGVRCGHREEDRIRLLIDSILKGFKPQVFPDAYTLTFIPVLKAEDTGIFLKVIRLSVHPPRQQGELLLYETDQGEVYLRRDGSIQGPLSGSAIQEWCRQKWTGEVRKLEERLEVLRKEKDSLQQQLNQQLRTPKSRICTVL
uniref:Schlafen like 1 n=1 Tax=Pelodiscus sinensis TaxID=13735 RepID=K7G7Y9_PELSI